MKDLSEAEPRWEKHHVLCTLVGRLVIYCQFTTRHIVPFNRPS